LRAIGIEQVLLTCGSGLFTLRCMIWTRLRTELAIFMLWSCGYAGAIGAADSFTVATYNLENYLLENQGNRTAKSAASKAKIRESLKALSPDVLAVQEIGGTNALLELVSTLRAEGLDYPHWEFVPGFDTNIQVAVLSRFPLSTRRPHSRESFLLNGRRFFTSRGIAEVEIRVNPSYSFTLINAHLKSKRAVGVADETELREQEAQRLREIIDARLAANPRLNLLVVGDFNDSKTANSTKVILGRGARALWDIRPAERNGDDQPNPNPAFPPRNITWTHYFAKDDVYSRIDYLLVSQGMAREWDSTGTYVLALPNWAVGSDHRPIIARFQAKER
jgi:endonuclease/exonuclease/phosphatase family metal-dependent hydrolase